MSINIDDTYNRISDSDIAARQKILKQEMKDISAKEQTYIENMRLAPNTEKKMEFHAKAKDCHQQIKTRSDEFKALENLKKQRAQRENIKERGKITTEEVMKSYSKDHNGGHPYNYNGGKTR